MPEMPEVETIRRSLAPHIEGRRIAAIDLRLPRLVKYPDAPSFIGRLTGRTVKKLARRGKYLLFSLDNGDDFIVHLRMTGQLYFSPDGATDWPHTRLALQLDDGSALLFADLRTLGALYVANESELAHIKGLHTLGPEALSADFTPEYLANFAAKKKTKIKSLLLDQSAIAGLGNIYADEALYLAQIHPLRPASSLNKKEIAALYAAINQVIADGIKDGGTTFSDYRDAHGEKGSHQDNLNAYQRTGQPCKNCGALLERLVIGGRSAHFCPRCQH